MVPLALVAVKIYQISFPKLKPGQLRLMTKLRAGSLEFDSRQG
jgi:hypothetical protein